MDRQVIIRNLEALAARLNQRGIQGELYIVGGAAMALAYDARRATRDVDAVFVPKAEIYQTAREVAAEVGLPEGWLNDAVKGFLAGPDPDACHLNVSDVEEAVAIVLSIYPEARLTPRTRFILEEILSSPPGV